MSMRLLLFGAVVAALATAPAFTQSRSERRAAEIAAFEPTGAPSTDCLQITRIRESRVLSDQIIDFHMDNGEVFRNELPNRCPQLGFEEAFSYSTSINQLCSVDIITVVIRGGGPMRGAGCGLGRFTPVKRVEQAEEGRAAPGR
ncbi:MAG: hypothetical protein SNJ79_00580 [Sphingomonadaceae bacterium]